MKVIIKSKGEKEMARMNMALAAITGRFKAANVPGDSRDVKIMDGLIEQDRNFFETQETADKGAAAFAAMAETAAMQAKKQPRASDAVVKQPWLAAMKAAAEQTVANIESGNFSGGGSSSLSPEYAVQKQRKHGLTMPIGKATGEFLRSLTTNLSQTKLEKL